MADLTEQETRTRFITPAIQRADWRPEQKRIVAKVDQLMALCDALETRLSQDQAAQANLTAATLYHGLKEIST